MENKCPKCGRKLGIFDLKQNCPECGCNINVLRYGEAP